MSICNQPGGYTKKATVSLEEKGSANPGFVETLPAQGLVPATILHKYIVLWELLLVAEYIDAVFGGGKLMNQKDPYEVSQQKTPSLPAPKHGYPGLHTNVDPASTETICQRIPPSKTSANFPEILQQLLASNPRKILYRVTQNEPPSDDTTPSTNLLIFHILYHPRGLTRQQVQHVYADTVGPLIPERRLLVAVSQPKNIRDRVCRT
jgi:hypothetical protein